jgi:C-5 cytosine-specific DNA methylase
MRTQTVELFCGTKSFSEVAKTLGHATHTIDNDPRHEADVTADIRDVKVIPRTDVLWASPPCEAFSVAAIGRNWNPDYTPKHVRAVAAQLIIKKTMSIIQEARPTWWFIENPRGMLRKLAWFDHVVRDMLGVRHTVTYCQYGDARMKPTDIWTNAWWWTPKTACNNGDPCHEPAPRGARTGTQGIRGAGDRGRIPSGLFTELFGQLASHTLRDAA